MIKLSGDYNKMSKRPIFPMNIFIFKKRSIVCTSITHRKLYAKYRLQRSRLIYFSWIPTVTDGAVYQVGHGRTLKSSDSKLMLRVETSLSPNNFTFSYVYIICRLFWKNRHLLEIGQKGKKIAHHKSIIKKNQNALFFSSDFWKFRRRL